jgi:bile acid-coenzyme A ligase
MAEAQAPFSTCLRQSRGQLGYESSSRLGAITAPTLILHGEHDRLAPVANAHLMHRKITGSRLVVIPDAAHSLMTDAPDQSVKEVITMLTEPPDDASARPFGAVLRDLAAAGPNRAAVTCGEETVSRQELLDRILRVAGHLADAGVTASGRVTIALPNSIDCLVAMHAVWWLGATPQPISDRLPAHEQAEIIELAKPQVVIGDVVDVADGLPVITTADLHKVAVAGAPYTGEPAAAPIWKIVTSGGSTGRPKLIVATQPAVAASVLPLAQLLAMPTEGTVVMTAPLTHNAPLVASTATLLLGSHLVLMPRFDASTCLRLVAQHRAEWLYLVPTMMQRIWRLPTDERTSYDLSSLEVAFHMAAPCPRWLKQEWIDWLGANRIWELYGGTELQAMTVVKGDEWLEHPGTVGRPVLGEIECRDANGTALPSGAVGELWMRRGEGQPAPYSYVGAVAKSAADGWESLGDHGYLDADGYVYITDREADMIVVGGANVYPAEIEAALDAHPAVRSSCVIGLPHEDLGNVPHAIVECDGDVSDQELLDHLLPRLAKSKLPRSFERSDAPLRDDAGKVRRSALRAERLGRTT